jgi:transposase
MSFNPAILPDTFEELRRFAITAQEMLEAGADELKIRTAELAASREELAAAKAGLALKTLEVEKLKFHLARLRRMQFGQSSERLNRAIEQLELRLEELETSGAGAEAAAEASQPEGREDEKKAGEKKRERKPREQRRNFPEHLPQRTETHEPPAACPNCGGDKLRQVSEDKTKILEYVPGHFEVVWHVRPVCSCRSCETMVQAPMPPLPILRGMAGPGLLAHIAVSKYCDHLPLYRQAEIYRREGVDLDRSLMAGWLGHCSWLVQPIVEAIGDHIKQSEVIHADDTVVKMLAPGSGKTKTARFWVYLTDGRPHGSNVPPAVLYRYTPDRKGERPQKELAGFKGFLHADCYAGFNGLYADKGQGPEVFEVSCWTHARRKFFDIYKTNKCAMSFQAMESIGQLFAVERTVNGKTPGERLAARQAESVPILESFAAWLDETLAKVSAKSELANSIKYVRARWKSFIRYTEDGRLEISNNAVERQVRPAAIGRKNWLFVGSEAGGDTAAGFYTLIHTARLNGVDPEAYLRYLFEHAGQHPINRIWELLPWNLAPKLAKLPPDG